MRTQAVELKRNPKRNEKRELENLKIISQFKQGMASNEMLKGYSGWGGLKDAIYTPSIYKELKKIMTMDEINSLKKTLGNAYYTPVEIVQFMYNWLVAYGFKGGNILEPSAGLGVFLEHMPASIQKNSFIKAIELDSITSQMVEQAHTHVSVSNIGFEQYQPKMKFDLIIGNPPYGSDKVTDSGHPDLKDHRIHHYFAAKSMRLLKEGGILAMVLPSFFMDNYSEHVRDIIQNEGGGLLAAYRLPEDLFTDAKITVDVIFLTKGQSDQKWVNTKPIMIDGIRKPLNEYFHQNPAHILGNLKMVDMYDRKGLTCKQNGNTFEAMTEIVNQMKYAKFCKLSDDYNRLTQKIKAMEAIQMQLLIASQDLLAV